MATRTEIAENFTLWQEMVDPMGTMTEQEFEAMSTTEKLAIQTAAFGPEDIDEPVETVFIRIRIETGTLAGSMAWQGTDNGELIGMFDDEGYELHLGNCEWTAIVSDDAPAWL